MSQEDEFVPLKEPPSRVHKHRVGDLVRQVHDTLLHLLGRHRVLDGFLEHHVESLGSGQCEPGGSAAIAAATGSFRLILTGALGRGGVEETSSLASQVGFSSTLWFLLPHVLSDLGSHEGPAPSVADLE